jgi:geranylgeranyl diphosphate synthase, type II
MMHTFSELSSQFDTQFNQRHFPVNVPTLYDPAQYILGLGGKRVRPVAVLMGNELFDELSKDAYHVATAIELFHNFSLIHDDIMDKAPLRRGMETVHTRYGEPTALLAGDVMLVVAYEYLQKTNPALLPALLRLFNDTAKEVCEGQQLDMDFEQRDTVGLEEYVHMITLKTSVLLAASLRMGAMLGGASEGNQNHLYAFGKNLGIAFQVQDDYLDAFGDPEVFGKQPGGDILANKKTFLLIHTQETATPAQRQQLAELMAGNAPDKVQKVLELFRACGVDEWATALKEKYLSTALHHLEEVAVLSSRKKHLTDLAHYLISRNK